MIAACAVHVPVHRIPAHVVVIRQGHALPRRPPPKEKLWLQAGDAVRVSRPARFTFVLSGNRYTVPHAHFRLDCARVLLRSGRHASRPKLLAVRLTSGRVEIRAGGHARRALVLTPEMLALAKHAGTRFIVERNPSASRTRATTTNDPILAAKAKRPSLRITSR